MADGSDVLTGGTIEPRFLEEEMRSSYLDYAMSVIVGRALPDVRDGLKPVHRRVLYAMHDAGLQPNRGYVKCASIAVGMATNIPPHNLRESIDAVIAYMDNPKIDTAGWMKHIKGPDFPTGGIIVGRSGIKDAYETGRGRVVIRARAHVEPLRQGKEAIIVTEMPYQVTKGDGRGDGGGLIKKIAEVVQDRKVPEISDLRDESSDKGGVRIVIELKRD